MCLCVYVCLGFYKYFVIIIVVVGVVVAVKFVVFLSTPLWRNQPVKPKVVCCCFCCYYSSSAASKPRFLICDNICKFSMINSNYNNSNDNNLLTLFLFISVVVVVVVKYFPLLLFCFCCRLLGLVWLGWVGLFADYCVSVVVLTFVKRLKPWNISFFFFFFFYIFKPSFVCNLLYVCMFVCTMWVYLQWQQITIKIKSLNKIQDEVFFFVRSPNWVSVCLVVKKF